MVEEESSSPGNLGNVRPDGLWQSSDEVCRVRLELGWQMLRCVVCRRCFVIFPWHACYRNTKQIDLCRSITLCA